MSQLVEYDNTHYQLLKRHECARIDIYIKYLKEIKSNEILVRSIEKYHKTQEKADESSQDLGIVKKMNILDNEMEKLIKS